MWRTPNRAMGYINVRWAVIVMLIYLLRIDAKDLDLIGATKGNKLQRCTYEKAYRMNGAFCSGLNLHYVPSTLKTHIEILDLSVNRIRDLRNTTFIDFGNLRFLYLGDNMIQHIEMNTFEPLTSLEVLDLSLNGLRTIPEPILNLPSLRKLYFADNGLTDLINELKDIKKPIQAPLNYLNIANCALREFPDFGILPDLEHLNISGNELKTIGPKDFTKLCGLKALDLTGNMLSDDVCLNKPAAMWFIDKGIVTIPETYSMFNPNEEEKKRCIDIPMDEEDEITYVECKARIQVKEEKKAKKKTWIIIGSCLLGILFIGMCFLYIIHKRNIKQAKILAMQEENAQKFIKA